MSSRDSRHRLIQKLAWSGPGHALLRGWLGLRRRIDYVALNQSLHTPTNGEVWLLGQLPEVPVIYDVGFNDGDFTASVLETRPKGRVVAFDPSRAAGAAHAARFASDSRVRFVNAALSSRAGEAEFHDYGNMSSSLAARADLEAGGVTSYRVPVRTLDEFAASNGEGPIDFLKIDAEGFDLHVLEGAGELLAGEQVDLFMFEYADGWISSRRFLEEACRYIAGKPYGLYRLYNGFLAPFEYASRHERFDLGCMFVGVSRRRMAQQPLRVREIPF